MAKRQTGRLKTVADVVKLVLAAVLLIALMVAGFMLDKWRWSCG